MAETVNPLTKLAVALIWFAASLFTVDIAFQAALLLAALTVTLAFGRFELRAVLIAHAFLAIAGLGILNATLMFHGEAGTYTRSLSGMSPGGAAWRDGIGLFLRTVAQGSISLAFVATTTPGPLMRALMLRAGLPARFAFALQSALQFVPTLAEDIARARLARAMRGKPTGGRFSRWADLAIPTLASALRRAGRVAVAMEARGLAPGVTRSSRLPSRFGMADALFLAAALPGPWLLHLLVAGRL